MRQTTHILFEWEACYQATLPGGRVSSSHEYRSIIIHQLDNPAKFNIPSNAVQTPVYYGFYLERWYTTNGKELSLPHRVHLFKRERG